MLLLLLLLLSKLHFEPQPSWRRAVYRTHCQASPAPLLLPLVLQLRCHPVLTA
jgi:hypothetical protein